MTRRGGSVPLNPKDLGTLVTPAWTRLARSFADGSQLRSRGKEGCSSWLWQDREIVRLFSSLGLLSSVLNESRKRGCGAMTLTPQRARTRGVSERAGSCGFNGTEPPLRFTWTLR